MPAHRLVVALAAALSILGAILGGAVLHNAVGAIGLGLAGVLLGVAFVAMGAAPIEDDRQEPDRFEAIDATRHEELLRGTSLFLREARSRVSIRPARSNDGIFDANVNGVRLGFIPAVICDQATDTEDGGFVAFVHDGRRWRGPGLPCPGSVEDALERALRCVSPVDLA